MASTSGNLVLSLELKEQLERWATFVSKPKGTVLFRRGDSVSGMYLIRSGRVSLGLDCETSVYPTRILGEGAIVGLPATVSGAPYSLTATVVQEAELGFIDRQAVLECLRRNPHLCFQVMEILSGEISGIRSALKRNDPPRHGKA